MLAHRCAASSLEAEHVGSSGECGRNSTSTDLTSRMPVEAEFFYFFSGFKFCRGGLLSWGIFTEETVRPDSAWETHFSGCTKI